MIIESILAFLTISSRGANDDSLPQISKIRKILKSATTSRRAVCAPEFQLMANRFCARGPL
jgi:hypothetical protein